MGAPTRTAWLAGTPAVFALSLVFATGRALAAEPVPLRVTRGEGAGECPDAATLAARVATSRSDAYSTTPASRDEGVHVAFERDGSGLRARIEASGGRQRTLAEPVPGCDGLAEAVVLALLLSADDLDQGGAPAPRTEAPPSRPLTSAPPSRTEVRASAGGVGSMGMIRALSGGAMIGAHVGPRDGIWSVGLVGLWLPPTSVALSPSNPTAPSGSVDLAYLGAALEGCVRFLRHAPFRAEACARVDGGAIDASARGFTTNASSGRFQAAGGGTLRASYEIVEPAAVFVELGTRVPFHREAFAIQNVGTVYDPPPVGLLGAAGVAWSFR